MRKRRFPQGSPPEPQNSWAASAQKDRLNPQRAKGAPSWAYAATGLAMGAVIGLGIFFWPTSPEASATSAARQVTRSFSLCHRGGGANCVVDGDTIWMDGIKIRVSDIDTPETHPSRCDSEADLGNRATQRLLQLVNQGPFEAQSIGNRDQDRYGRKLRVLVRDGQSLGDVLVREGLARTWTGRREPWC